MNIDATHADRIVLQPDTDDEAMSLIEARRRLAATDLDDVLAWWTLDTPEYDGLDDRDAGAVGEKALVVSWGGTL